MLRDPGLLESDHPNLVSSRSITLLPYLANMRRWPNVGLLFAHRLRRWSNSKPTLDQRPVYGGYTMPQKVVIAYFSSLMSTWYLKGKPLCIKFYNSKLGM